MQNLIRREWNEKMLADPFAFYLTACQQVKKSKYVK